MSALVPPRIAHYPDYAYSSGPDFTELAAIAGLALDPWQAWVLEKGLGERPDGKWASFQNTLIVSRQNGKDAIFEALGLGWLFLTGERLIGHSAHEYKTAMEAFRRLVSLIENTDDLRRKVKKIINTNGEEGIELLTGQRMRFLARSKGAGRGFSFDKMIWNEAYALVAAQVDAVLPTMSARPNPQLWLGSSPPLDEATGEALFRARNAALDGNAGVAFFDWGLDVTLDKIGPCARDTCSHRATEVGCILDDPATHTATNPSYPHRISAEAIARERSGMDAKGFARERIGIWPPNLSDGFAVISQRQWEAMTDTESGADLVGKPAVAVDVSPRSVGPTRGSISIAQRRANGKIHLELIMFGPGTHWIPDALAGLQKMHKPMGIFIDPGSAAGSIIPDVQALGITIDTMSSRDVAQAFGMIYDAATSENAEDRTVTHLGQSETTLAVQGAGKRPVGDGHAWDRRKANADITSLVSMTHALWGLVTKSASPAAVAPWVMYV